MLTDEAKRLIEEGRLNVDNWDKKGAALILKPEPFCGGKIMAKIGRGVVRDKVINEAARHIIEVDDVFNGKLSPRLEKVMIKALHVSIADVELMTEEELDVLYGKACDYEEDKAIESCEETEGRLSQEAEDAAHIVDWIVGRTEGFGERTSKRGAIIRRGFDIDGYDAGRMGNAVFEWKLGIIPTECITP